MAEVASIVIFTDKREETVACYGALGIVLADEEHGDGVVQAAGEVGGVHLAVVPAAAAGISPRWRAGGSTFVGFWVSSLEATVARPPRSAPPCSSATRTASGAVASLSPIPTVGPSR